MFGDCRATRFSAPSTTAARDGDRKTSAFAAQQDGHAGAGVAAEGAPGGDAGAEGGEMEEAAALQLGAGQAAVALGQVGARLAVVAQRALPGLMAGLRVGVDGGVGEQEDAAGAEDAVDSARARGRRVASGATPPSPRRTIRPAGAGPPARRTRRRTRGSSIAPSPVSLASRSRAVTRCVPASRRASHPLPAPRSSTRSDRGSSARHPRRRGVVPRRGSARCRGCGPVVSRKGRPRTKPGLVEANLPPAAAAGSPRRTEKPDWA